MGQIIFYILFTIVAVLGAKFFIAKQGHPKGLFYLFFAEMWERFSFYGMRALLTLYIAKEYMAHLGEDEAKTVAVGIYAAYGALVYATPLLGGFIADKFIGYRKSIILGGVLMTLGHFAMAFQGDFFFYGALGLLIAGNGFFKPNISSLVGALYKEGDIKRDSGFTIFYMGINLGAAVAPLLCGYIGETWGWHYGFGLAGIGMAAGVVVFWDGIKKNVFGDKGLQPVEYIDKKFFNFNIEKLIWVFGFLIVPIFAYLIVLAAGGSHFLENLGLILVGLCLLYSIYLIYSLYQKGEGQAGNKIGAIWILAVLCAVFWACFEQAGSSLVLWADECVDLKFMVPSQTNAINPGYIIFLAFPFALLWQKLDLWGRNPNTPKKFALGLAFLGLGFLAFAYSVHFINTAGKLPFLTLWIGWLLITTGELCLSPIGLSKVTQLSPKKAVAFFMGLWFLSSTVAHIIAGQLAKLTTGGVVTEKSTGFLAKLNKMFFSGVDPNGVGVADAMVYNDLFAKIGFVTIGIAIVTLIISPLIKKLMGDVH